MQFCRLKTLLVNSAVAEPRQIYRPLLTVNDVVCCGSPALPSTLLSSSLSLALSIASCEEAKLANSYCYSAKPAEAQFKFGCGCVRKRNANRVAEKRFPLWSCRRKESKPSTTTASTTTTTANELLLFCPKRGACFEMWGGSTCAATFQLESACCSCNCGTWDKPQREHSQREGR